jgi:uncharacterized membrane protein SpoIIM required for sporulation
MVLEHILPEGWLEQKARYAFLLGAGYSVISILLAKFLFPGDPALVAVAFTSLMLLPELYKIFSIEERQERMAKKVSVRELYKDDIDVVKVYLFLFLGILLTYSLAAIMLPSFQASDLFQQQLEVRGGLPSEESAGAAMMFTPSLFSDLLANNFKVMMVVFIIALLTGNGAVFIIVWNASVWGTIFGITAKCAASFAGYNPYYLFFLVFLVVLPHMVIEALAYILAAISGSIISKDVLMERFDTDRFNKVFKFNMYLLGFALVFLLLGALVETYVLDNVTLYYEIIQLSFEGIC